MNILKPIRNNEVFWPLAQCICPLQSKPRSGYYCPWASIVAEKLDDFLPLFSIIIINNFSGSVSLTELKRPGRDVVHSPPSSTEVRNEWSYTSTLHIYRHDVYRDKFTFFTSRHFWVCIYVFFPPPLAEGLSYFLGGWKDVKGKFKAKFQLPSWRSLGQPAEQPVFRLRLEWSTSLQSPQASYSPFTYVSSHAGEMHAIFVGCSGSEKHAFCL